MEFTKEQLIERCQGEIECAQITIRNGTSDTPNAVAERLELFEIALASLAAPPVYQVQYGNDWRDVERGQYDDHAAHGSPVRVVYAAPPAPVVPDEMAISDDMNLYQKSFAQGHNACRAAIIKHGGE